jgi:hypothetical protein
MKKDIKLVDLAVKRYSRQVLGAFDKLEHQQRREQAEKRAEIERKARNTN